MNFTQYIQFRALARKAQVQGQSLNYEAIERLVEKEMAASPLIKTVCAPISIELFERLSSTLSELDISKRTFIESAIIEALNRADAIMAEVDIFEGLESPQSHHQGLAADQGRA